MSGFCGYPIIKTKKELLYMSLFWGAVFVIVLVSYKMVQHFDMSAINFDGLAKIFKDEK